MDDDLDGLRCIAWSLRKPPYLSAGNRAMRARNAWIMTVDNYLIVGFGVDHRDPRYTVKRFSDARTAQRNALADTQSRERAGFVLTIDPVTATAKGGKREWLDMQVSAPVASDLHKSMTHLLQKGKPLSPEYVTQKHGRLDREAYDVVRFS